MSETTQVTATTSDITRKELFALQAIEKPTPEQLAKIEALQTAIKLSDLFTGLAKDMPEIRKRSQNACLALSKIQSISSKEDDEAAEKLLVRVRTAYQEISDTRKGHTVVLDTLKTEMMLPEKKISNLKTDEGTSEYLRVVGLRNKYNAEVERKRKEEADRILKEKNAKEEKIYLTGIFETRFMENIANAINNTIIGMEQFFNGLVLSDFPPDAIADEKLYKVSRFNLKPVLKLDVFQSWFKVDYDKAKLSDADFDTFLNEIIKPKYDYETLNAQYVEKVESVMSEWKAKLPGKKEQLKQIEDLRLKDSAAAEEREKEIKAKADFEAEELKKKQAAELEAKRTEIQTAQRSQQLENTFDAQVQIDNIEEASGIKKKRVAVIDNVPEGKIVDVFARVLLACYRNKKFKGHLKADSKGNMMPPDENGNPVYTDWANELLSFFAQNCDVAIEGIKIVEVVTTIQKSR